MHFVISLPGVLLSPFLPLFSQVWFLFWTKKKEEKKKEKEKKGNKPDEKLESVFGRKIMKKARVKKKAKAFIDFCVFVVFSFPYFIFEKNKRTEIHGNVGQCFFLLFSHLF